MKRGVILLAVLITGHLSLLASEPSALFEEHFQDRLGSGWTWLREDPSAWCIRDHALEIRVVPGKAHDVKNALLRSAPDRRQGTFAIEVTVTNPTKPTQQYEQACLTWYHNGKPVFKLVKEYIDGDLWIIPGKIPMRAKTVQIRLVVAPDGYVAQFRPHAKGPFKTAATGSLPGPGSDQISIQCYNGPPDAEHWIRFDDFRIVRLSK